MIEFEALETLETTSNSNSYPAFEYYLKFLPAAQRHGQGMLIQSINGIEIQSTENLLKINESEIYEIEFMNKKQESFRFFFDWLNQYQSTVPGVFLDK